MKRREFLIGAIEVVAATAIPSIAGVSVHRQHRYLIYPIDGIERFHLHLEAKYLDRACSTTSMVMSGFGSLWYGHEKPTVIISSPVYLLEWWKKLQLQSRFTMKYRGVQCPRFSGAAWWDWEKGIKPNRIYFLNENLPHDPKFNGWFDVEGSCPDTWKAE